MGLLLTLACSPVENTFEVAVDKPDRSSPIWEDTGDDGEPGGSDDSETDDPDDDPLDDTGDEPPSGDIYSDCFASFMSPDYPLPDYDQAGARIGSHCLGTDHQDIPDDIERVVFIGDSVTLGSPPTASEAWYRNVLAETLAERYGLEKPEWLWQQADLISGKPYETFSGDFGVCAKWGGRTDDLMRDNSQVLDCLPESDRDLSTLVVMTSGGNDVFKAIQAQMEGAGEAEIEAKYEEWVELMEGAVTWIAGEDFPGGVYVIFANVYEYSDGTMDLGSCPGADMVGYGDVDSAFIDDLTRRAMGDYLALAVDTQTDMLLLREGFCGHGYNAGDSSAPCYRGSSAATWFDDTCIHPNASGHAAIAEMVLSVIDE